MVGEVARTCELTGLGIARKWLANTFDIDLNPPIVFRWSTMARAVLMPIRGISISCVSLTALRSNRSSPSFKAFFRSDVQVGAAASITEIMR